MLQRSLLKTGTRLPPHLLLLAVGRDAALLLPARLGRRRCLAQQAALKERGLLRRRPRFCLLARLALSPLPHLRIQRLLVHLQVFVGVERHGCEECGRGKCARRSPRRRLAAAAAAAQGWPC